MSEYLWDTDSDAAAERDLEAFDRIFEILDGTEWHASTLDDIAQVVISTGRTIRPPLEEDEDQ